MRSGFCIFINTVFEGPVPVEYDENNCPVLYDNEKEAELQIVEYIEDRLAEFKQGNRDFEDATNVEEYVIRVTHYPDKSLSDEYGRTICYSKPALPQNS